MDIIIKNVTGEIDNHYLISELRRCGFPEGSVVRNTIYNRKNKSCCWSSGTDHCTAYIGKTCVKKKRISEISVFSLREGGMAVCGYVDGKKVEPVKLSREDVMSYVSSPAHARKIAEKYLTS